MKTFLLSLGVLATLAAPAVAGGRLDNTDPLVNQTYTAPAPQGVIDYSTTRSIGPAASDSQFDKQRGDQGAFFGANGR